MSKRTAAGGIKAALALQADKAAADAQLQWPPLEAPQAGVPSPPEEYLQDVLQKSEDYGKRTADVVRLIDQAERAAAAAAAGPGSAAAAAAEQAEEEEDGDRSDGHAQPGSLTEQQRTRLLSWQSLAAFCVQQLGMWPGSGIALPHAQQELLLRVVAHHDLHLDAAISPRAHALLLQHLRDHPPAMLQPPPAGAAGSSSSQPPVLVCATLSGTCWDLGFGPGSTPVLPHAPSPFPLLQQLVRNAVLLVTGGSGSQGPERSLQGEGLLLLYVVELLQADLLPRQAAFEQHRQLLRSLPSQVAKDEAARRAATVLQHSLLFRVMQDDSIGGDTWRYLPGQHKGKHPLVRELLLLASCTGDDPQPAAPAGFATLRATLAASAEALGAAGSNPAAAMAPPVAAADLVSAARRLLLLLLQLFSSCEEAGVYEAASSGRAHMQRSVAGAAQPNDRAELDEAMMQAIGTGGHVSAHRLPQLAYYAPLMRLLHALPPLHRVRLLSLMVVECIKARAVDPESEGKLAGSAANQQVALLKGYLLDRGKGASGFRQPRALDILRAVEARLEWASKDMFGGGPLMAALMACLISGAAELKQQPEGEQQALADVSRRVLEHVVQQQRNNLASLVLDGHPETATAVTAALRGLPQPSST